MADQAPVWITEPGSLGVVPEGKFYRIGLNAVDPDFPEDPTKVTYRLISGELPSGVQVNTNGIIEGIPVSIADFKGVPADVSENITAKFAIRVTDEEDRIADRTFTITVSGQDAPEFITPPGQLAEYFDGDIVNLQVQVYDDDPNDVLVVSLIAGSLPPGVTVSEDGAISGVIIPTPDLDNSAVSGWDAEDNNFDIYPNDFSTRSISVNYEFTLQVTDGKDVTLRKFSIYVYSKDGITADSVEFTVDNDFITADITSIREPYLTDQLEDFSRYSVSENPVPPTEGYSIGTFRHDNFFAYQFNGIDPDREPLEYIAIGTLPPELTLNSETGWLTGNLASVGLTEQDYFFIIVVRKLLQPDIRSPYYNFAMTVIGEIETNVTWLTDYDLGVINNGEISTLFVEAQHQNTSLQYRLKQGGGYNKLPQGLTLLSSGNIAGQVSFKTFSLDGGTTTFDSDHITRLQVDPTTFDMTFNFTVEAFSSNGVVSVTKDFTLLLNREYDKPHNILYCKAMPPLEDRDLLNTLLLNNSVFVPSAIYRMDDKNFGIASNITYQHAFGLSPATIEDYFASTELNHYNKTLVLGEIKTAVALDENENILYEVVYSQIIDDQVNPDFESTSPELNISAPAIHNGSEVSTVYPNSLQNMREQVVDQIGQESKVLPRWMLSKQEDGEVLGFTPAWVLAYTNPGKSSFIKYHVTEFFNTQLNTIDFEVDRYELEYKASFDWDLNAQEWLESVLTTFDRENMSQITVTADTTAFTADTDQWPYADHASADTTTPTIFDGGSCRFISPNSVEDQTDKHDRYIMFPQKQIVNNNV